MSVNEHRWKAPLGSVEPHAAMLKVPAADHRLYKVMSVENLLRSLQGGYLHFNRVDAYADFPGADAHDGEQPPRDEPGNRGATFQLAPEFSAADYYKRSRERTYACCFAMENTPDIWKEYGNSGTHGKVCLVTRFGRLRERINETLSGQTFLMAKGVPCRQIFSVNYGQVEYVDWSEHEANTVRLPNPVTYTYLKDKRFAAERELRISLSAVGIGQFQLSGGANLEFQKSLELSFDIRRAMADQTVEELRTSSDCDAPFLYAELAKAGIDAVGHRG